MTNAIVKKCCEMLMDANDETFDNVLKEVYEILNEFDKIVIDSLKNNSNTTKNKV